MYKIRIKMTYISITNFEIKKIYATDGVVYLKFYINNSNFITFPFYIKNIQTEIIDKFIKVLTGKDVVINLKLDEDSTESKLLQIKKEYILFNIIKNYEGNIPLIQETYLVFENNSIFRNAIRKFINDEQTNIYYSSFY
jgi:hypothetical protein